MPKIQDLVSIISFGAFEVNLQSRELRKHGLRIRLEEKPFRILEMLISNPGQVIPREALFARLWPDTHVGFEHSLNTAVNKLRDLLGDSAHSPRFVETVPRAGYRFISPVKKPVAVEATTGKKILGVPADAAPRVGTALGLELPS